MKRLLLALGLLVSCNTFAAEQVATLNDGIVVTLYDTPCDSAIALDQVKDKYKTRMQNGKVNHPDREVRLCWGLFPEFSGMEASIGVVDEEGVYGPIELKHFAPK